MVFFFTLVQLFNFSFLTEDTEHCCGFRRKEEMECNQMKIGPGLDQSPDSGNIPRDWVWSQRNIDKNRRKNWMEERRWDHGETLDGS